LELKCQADLKAEIYVSSPCFELLRTVVSESFGNGSPYKVSQYDARKVEKVGVSRNFPEGHKDVEAYLGGSGKQSIAKDYKQVLAAIHSMPSHHAGQEYEECTDPPYNAL
jgi:carboxypeptidase D